MKVQKKIGYYPQPIITPRIITQNELLFDWYRNNDVEIYPVFSDGTKGLSVSLKNIYRWGKEDMILVDGEFFGYCAAFHRDMPFSMEKNPAGQ